MITITRGDDRVLNLFFNRNNGRPFDLTGWTKIAVIFKKKDGTFLEKNTIPYNIAAYARYNDILFTAETPGLIGNNISLVFDGVKSVQQVINEWNTSYPFNKVRSNASPTLVLPAMTINLANGRENVQDVRVISAVLGHVVVNLHDTDTVQMMLGKAMTFKAIIDKGEPTAGERRIVMFRNQLEVIDDKF